MARRRRGCRRHRSTQQQPDQPNDREYDDVSQHFTHARRAMQQEIAQQEERRQALNSNMVLKKASEAAAKECRVFVRNVPNTATAMELAQFLGSNLGGRIDEVLRVEMHRRGVRAWARVILASKDVLNTLLTRDLCMGGRILGCSMDNRGTNSDRHRNAYTTVIPARQLILRKNFADPGTKSPTTAAFTTTKDVLLELNASRKFQLVIEFGAFRIEFSLGMVKWHSLFKIRSASRETNSLCLRLVLRRPPLCYRFVEDALDTMLNSLSLASMLLRGVNKNPMVWDRNPDAFLGMGYWDRTTDPSSGSTFGHCLVYDLVVDEQYGTKLAHKMHELSMFRTTPVYISNALLEPRIDRLEARDWSGGFDVAFEQVPYAVRYLVHANVAANKLVFETFDEAQRVSAVLLLCDPEHATNVLTDLFLGLPEARPVDVLLRWLNEAPLDEDVDEDKLTGALPESICLTRRILVTPLRVCPQLPEMDMSNRILRQFSSYNERFVRVAFVDENFGSILQAKTNDVFNGRIRYLLRDGIIIAGCRFAFLAFSNSQLREQSAWFYNETPSTMEQIPSANEIRASVGDLSSILIVGKYASRLGQGFSSTTNVATIPPAHFCTISDVQRHGFTFSDGVGVMSRGVALNAALALQLDYLPSALQIRFGGSKGVVSLCPPGVSMRSGKELLLRASMTKFAGNPEHHDLEICSVAKAMPCYLNRQAITVLTAMHVPDNSFLNLMYRMIQDLESATSTNEHARAFLRAHANHSIVNRLLDAGFPIKTDRFMREWIGAVRNRLLLDLRLKARIFVPQGIMLMGIMDETQTLPPDQIFFQVRDPKRTSVQKKGAILAVGRNPCLHPGDIRLLRMSDVSMFPQLKGLFDVLVFSAQGDRPQPNMMSGGDLDGDLYFAIWDPSIVDFAHECPPMEYNAPPAPTRMPRVTNERVQDFFVNYIKNDNLGVIANAHVAFADINDDGARSKECLQLAAVHSTAVDFCKTGIPAEMPRSLKAEAYPHFMENSFKASYESKNVLGQIFDIAGYAEKNSASGSNNGLQSMSWDPAVSNGFDACLLFPGFERYVDHAWTTLDEFMWGLWDIACIYGVFDEAQLVSGFASKFSRKVSRQKGQKGDANSAGGRMDIAVRALQQIYKNEFWNEFELIDEYQLHEDIFSDEVLAKASAWYFCAYTYSDDSGYAPYLSFAWLATKPMCQLRAQVYGTAATLY